MRLDPGGMLDAVRSFPDHLEQGWALAAELRAPHRVDGLDHVLVLGMGGSAIGADLLRTYAAPGARVPVSVCRGYGLPGWVNERTLVIASSYSGDTEETLEAFSAAVARGAAIYAVTSGGQLLARAHDMDLPHVVLPGGLQPRAALGYSFAALLRIAETIGLIEPVASELHETTDLLRDGASRLGREGSRAFEIADLIRDRIALVYTGAGLLEPVGLRWRNQFQENAKQLAFGNAFPELNHNEIMGWEHAPEAIRRNFAVIVLRDRDDHPQIGKRMDITRELLAPRTGAWTEHEAREERPLARMLATLQLGDFVSVRRAYDAGTDPTPVETIQRLKRLLATG